MRDHQVQASKYVQTHAIIQHWFPEILVSGTHDRFEVFMIYKYDMPSRVKEDFGRSTLQHRRAHLLPCAIRSPAFAVPTIK